MFGRVVRSISAAWRELRASDYMLTDPAANWSVFWDSLVTASGTTVTPEKALRHGALYACGNILAQSVAQLPCSLRRIDANGSKEPAKEHNLYSILHNRFNPRMTAYQSRQMMQFHAATRGNAYAQILRDRGGRVVGLYPWRPDVVRVELDGLRLRYFLRTNTGAEAEYSQDDVLHIRGMSFDGLVGIDPIAHLRETLSEALSAQEFGGRFFAQGASPPFVLIEGSGSNVKSIPLPAREALERSFREKYSGAINAGRIPILYDGMDVKTLGSSNVDAQFLELRKFMIEETARFFRIPMHLLQSLDRSTFNNIVQQSLEFVIYTLLPWLENWEQQIELQLLTEAEKERYEVVFNVSAFLRGDTASRYDAYLKARTGGWMNINEIRELEDMNDIGPEGDGYGDALNTQKSNDSSSDGKSKQDGAGSDEAASIMNRLAGAGNGNGGTHVTI